MKNLSSFEIQNFRLMYEQNERIIDIAKHFCITTKNVRAVILELELPERSLPRIKRSKSRMTAADIDEMLRLYQSDSILVDEILKRFAIPISKLYAELQKNGIPRRKAMPSKVLDLDKRTRSKIIQAYKDGRQPKEIAKAFGLNYAQVYVVIREEGTEVRIDRLDPAHARSDIREEVHAMFLDERISREDIQNRLGISQRSLNRIVKELVLPPRGKGGGKRATPTSVQARMPEFLQRYQNGENLRSLAKEAGIGYSTLAAKIAAINKSNR